MLLFHATASPYSAKVRMAAVQCGIAIDEQVVVDTVSEPDALTSANPLGKIPTLVLDDGTALYDSRVICEYLDRQSGNAIVPRTHAEWAIAKRLEATADGVLDAALLVLYEGRHRPEDKRHDPWVERQWRRAMRGLAVLEREIGDVPSHPTIGHISVAAMVGWLTLRFEDKWEPRNPRLVTWESAFFDAFPGLQKVKPQL